jgi:nicotinate-nucleotide adenylyltransferase
MAGSRVCLFGGTFDPIHNAHLQMAEEAAARFQLNRVIFIPAGNPPHKNSRQVTPYEDRLAMVKLACADNPTFEISEMERGNERSYTFNTLQRFTPQLAPGDRLFFLIGADAFDELETWYRWHDVLQMTEFIVVSRPGKEYRIPAGGRVLRLDNVQLPAASRTIRSKVAAGQPTPELPHPVRRYIDAHGLYQSTRPSIT